MIGQTAVPTIFSANPHPPDAPLVAHDAMRDVWLMLAHDLRNPLLGIQKVLELIGLDAPAGSDRVSRLLEDARVNCALLIDMLGDVLEYYRSPPAPWPSGRGANLEEVIARALRLLRPHADERGIRFQVTLPPRAPGVACDAGKLSRVLMNLLHNAVKFSPPGAAIGIEVAPEGAGRLRIGVTDQGPGIHPDEVRRIFQKNRCAQGPPGAPTGFGWGLYYCQVAVQSMGGRLTVESPLEGGLPGARFVVVVAAQEAVSGAHV